MLYELGTFSAMPARFPISIAASPITLGYTKHSVQVVVWTNELGGASEQLIYILAYESLADREKKWGAFLTDQERLAKFAETEKNGPLVQRLTANIRPMAYSPMQ